MPLSGIFGALKVNKVLVMWLYPKKARLSFDSFEGIFGIIHKRNESREGRFIHKTTFSACAYKALDCD